MGWRPVNLKEHYGSLGEFFDPLRLNTLMHHGGGNEHEASDKLAALYRSDWADYMNRFMPEERRQVEAMSDRANTQERQQAISDVQSTFARAPEQLRQQAFTSGVSLTPEDKAAYGRELNTTQGLATVDAANRTTRKQTDRSYGVFAQGQYQPGGIGLSSTRGKVI